MKIKTLFEFLALAIIFCIPQVSRAELIDADYVLGQEDFVSSSSATTQDGMNRPYGVALDSTSGRLFVADRDNHRVLVFDVSGNITDGMNAVNVLGQPDFNTVAAGLDENSLSGPQDVLYDPVNEYLYVADFANTRVLVFDVATITDGEDAIHVLGQPDFTSNSQVTTQSGMRNPDGLALDQSGNRLFVSDQNNRRILIFDVSTISDGENAINVLGQPDFVTRVAETDQSSLNYPQDIFFDSDRNYLFVTEGDNNRVTIFDVNSITDGENAVKVLGASDFVTVNGGFSQTEICYPWGLGYDTENKHLFVGSECDARLQVWDVTEITDGEPAIGLIGHVNFTDSDSGDTTRNTIKIPLGSVFDYAHDRMYLADVNNNRVLVYSPIPTFSVVAADEDNDDDDEIDKHSKDYKNYKKYKPYKSETNKKIYQEVRKYKKENKQRYLALQTIYWKYKYLKKADFEKLPQTIKDQFNQYKKYRYYKNYKEYKEKVYGD